MKFTTELVQGEGKNVVGIIIPPEIIEGFHKGKRPPVRVTINGYSYRSTVAVISWLALPPNIARRLELKADRRTLGQDRSRGRGSHSSKKA